MPSFEGPLERDELIDKIVATILDDDNAMKKIRSKIKQLGSPSLITFTFDSQDPPKKVTIAYRDYQEALAKSIVVQGDGDSNEAAGSMLSGAFTHTTIRNAVINKIENDE